MSYELFAWPVNRAMTNDDAIAEIRARASRRSFGIGREQHVAGFAAEMDEQFPGVASGRNPIPMELELHRDWVHLGLPWSMATDLLGRIGYAAYEQGLALYDPQRSLVALPAPFGDGPLPLADREEHDRMAGDAMRELLGKVGIDPDGMPDGESREAGGR